MKIVEMTKAALIDYIVSNTTDPVAKDEFIADVTSSLENYPDRMNVSVPDDFKE